jgi:hypothetical protein
MPTREWLGQPFVVTGQSSEPAQPAEGAFDHPAPGQQDEPVLGCKRSRSLRSGVVRKWWSKQ